MDIIFQDSKLQKICSAPRFMNKLFGKDCGGRLKQRLDDFQAARTLEDLRTIPGARCHELHGDRKGQLSVDLKHPLRLIFQPANEPIPRKSDGGLDWLKVTAILIIEVVDTHG